MMSDPQLALTRLLSGPGDSLERWPRSDHCPVAPWRHTGHLLVAVLAPGKAGSPWQPPAPCGRGIQAGGVSHTQNENHMLGLALPQAAAPQFPLPLLLPSRSSPGYRVWGGGNQRPSVGELKRQVWLSDGHQALSLHLTGAEAL